METKVLLKLIDKIPESALAELLTDPDEEVRKIAEKIAAKKYQLT